MIERKNKFSYRFLLFIVVLTTLFSFIGLFEYVGNFFVNPKVTSNALEISIEVTNCENNSIVPSSGNLSFNNQHINGTIKSIENLTSGWVANICFYGDSYPIEWAEEAPSSSLINSSINHFDLSFNNNTNNGNYQIQFRLNENRFTNTDNVKLFTYDSEWTELSTSIIEPNGSGSTVLFVSSMTHFSKFIIGEKPDSSSEIDEESTGGGGGGGGSSTSLETLTITPNPIRISIKPGEEREVDISIKNNKNSNLNLVLDYSDLIGFIDHNEGSILDLVIPAKKENIIEILFEVDPHISPELYHKEIKIYDNNNILINKIPVIIEVLPAVPLFDVKIDVPFQYKYVSAGSDLLFGVRLINLDKVTQRADVIVTYSLFDKEGNIILTEHETLAIETQVNLLKEFKIPKYLIEDEYTLYVSVKTVNLEEVIGSSSETIIVTNERVPYLLKNTYLPYLILITGIIIGYIIYHTDPKKKKEKK